MNKRIQELALEAWISDCVEYNPTYKKGEHTELLLQSMKGFHKKFAELIINECATIINSENYREHSTGWNDAIKWAEGSIKEHFGVE